jgi:hypothetical protein
MRLLRTAESYCLAFSRWPGSQVRVEALTTPDADTQKTAGGAPIGQAEVAVTPGLHKDEHRVQDQRNNTRKDKLGGGKGGPCGSRGQRRQCERQRGEGHNSFIRSRTDGVTNTTNAPVAFQIAVVNTTAYIEKNSIEGIHGVHDGRMIDLRKPEGPMRLPEE